MPAGLIRVCRLSIIATLTSIMALTWQEIAEQVRPAEDELIERYRYGLFQGDAPRAGLRVALVAIERPDGLLIERPLDAGLTVIAVHPNQVKAMRPRYSVAGGKSDSFDSFVLAELARTEVGVTKRTRRLAGHSNGLNRPLLIAGPWIRPAG